MLDFSVTIGFTFVNLFVIYLFLKKFLWKPLTKAIEDRQKKIKADLDTAESEKAFAEKLKKQYEEFLGNADREAEDILKAARDDARERADAILAEARAEAEGIIAKAYRDIEMERESTRRQLTAETVSLALLCGEKLVGKSMDTESNREFVRAVMARESAK